MEEPSTTQSSGSGDNALRRRGFFRWVTVASGAVASAFFALPVAGYLLKMKKRPIEWVDLGKVGDFALNETRMVTFDNPIRQPWDGMTAHTGVYVRYNGKDEQRKDQFLVLAMNCAHLGCPVSWFPQSGLFMCPCHGGVYYATGERASGPPPRGLFRCVWRVSDGRLQVQAPHYPTLQDTLEQPA
jgi:menaquinol-cytochrome c reductase iron-sulfur subunit